MAMRFSSVALADGRCTTKPRSGERLQPWAKGVLFALRPGSIRNVSKPRWGERKLIPDVTFVVRHMVLFQECHEFFLERMLPVVFLLRCDVSGDRRNV
jgi:hypothetical protein